MAKTKLVTHDPVTGAIITKYYFNGVELPPFWDPSKKRKNEGDATRHELRKRLKGRSPSPWDSETSSNPPTGGAERTQSDAESEKPEPSADELKNEAPKAFLSPLKAQEDYPIDEVSIGCNKECESSGDSSLEDDKNVVSLPLKRKPRIHLARAKLGGNLKSRLEAFLPRLSAANDQLEKERLEKGLATRQVDRVDESEESYIEMNLGLGVLEEIRPDGYQAGEDGGVLLPGANPSRSEETISRERDAASKELLGTGKATSSKAGITEIDQ